MSAVAQAMERVGAQAAKVSGAWNWTLRNGELFRCSVREADVWLELSSRPVELAAVDSAWTALGLNNAHAGPGGIVETRAGGFALRADVFVGTGGDADVEERVGAAGAGFVDLLERLIDGPPKTGDRLQVCPLPEDFERRLTDAGWAAQTTQDGTSVNLVTSRRAFKAVVRASHGALAIDAELLDHNVTSPLCREALARYMLRTAGALRLVRGAVAVDGGRVRPRFAATLSVHASPDELHHGLAALSVACDTAGPECAALAVDALLAEQFLIAHQVDIDIP